MLDVFVMFREGVSYVRSVVFGKRVPYARCVRDVWERVYIRCVVFVIFGQVGTVCKV